MKKIPCIFVRKHIITSYAAFGEVVPESTNGSKYLAVDEINEGCHWVFNGEGIATVKWDGTAVLIRRRGGMYIAPNAQGIFESQGEPVQVYQRYATNQLSDNPEWISCGAHPGNGKNIYWVPVTDKWIIEALNNSKNLTEGTYEAIGPKINGNRYKADNHVLIKHGGNGPIEFFENHHRTFEGIKDFLKNFRMRIPELYEDSVMHEGIVFHHPDGRMAKIKRSDFIYG